MRDNSKTIGDLAELKVAAMFAEKGCFVSKPLTDNAPYDLIIDDGQLKKVQVKARCERDDKVLVELRTTMVNYVRNYEKDDFDLLAVYNTNNGKIAIFNWDQIGERKSLTLRTSAPKNNQVDKVLMFDDYIP
jgi:hypothetical protein